MPPSGAQPPTQAQTSTGAEIELAPLAGEICRRYRAEFPDEDARYGRAGHAWCLHDNQYLLAWAVQDARDGTVVLDDQALWLADVLHARGFPVDRLARDLEIAAAVVTEGMVDASFDLEVARHLQRASKAVRRWKRRAEMASGSSAAPRRAPRRRRASDDLA